MTLALGISWDTLSLAKTAPQPSLSQPQVLPFFPTPSPFPGAQGADSVQGSHGSTGVVLFHFSYLLPAHGYAPPPKEGRRDSSSCPTYPVLPETSLGQWVGTRWVGGVWAMQAGTVRQAESPWAVSLSVAHPHPAPVPGELCAQMLELLLSLPIAPPLPCAFCHFSSVSSVLPCQHQAQSWRQRPGMAGPGASSVSALSAGP